MTQHPIEKLWRECDLPEYFLGNGGSNDKLYALYDRIIEQCAKVCDELRRADYSAESPDWIAGADDCAKALRALANSSGIREGKS